jgi:(1->4)-alpha-D-glucan 1-alpha-D-glucosylmutase
MHAPQSTYRLQMNYQFTLDNAKQIVAYLNDLGIHDLYLSPILKSRSQSPHGYDVVDPTQINPELGTCSDLEGLSALLKKQQMGILLDIVPNHMYINSSENIWWNDLLYHGKQSKYSKYFDIFWDEVAAISPYQLVLPFLGQSLQEEVDQKHLIINVNDQHLSLKYYNQTYPLYSETPFIEGDHIQLISKQFYRLEQWSLGNNELQYRRFFDVSELACLRVEDPAVFEETHRQIIDWLNKGVIQGLRIDHIDGLNDPYEYIERLKNHHKESYILAEKILCGDETNRKDWNFQGTTGYDFLNELNSLFINPGSFDTLTNIFNSFTNNTQSIEQIHINSKLTIMNQIMIPEIQRLARYFQKIAHQYSSSVCLQAIKAFVAAFPVYRTYLSKHQTIHPKDEAIIRQALQSARKIAPQIPLNLWTQLQNIFDHPNTSSNDTFIFRLQQITGPIMAKGVEDTALYRFHPLCSMNEVGGELTQDHESLNSFHKRNYARATYWPQTLLATSTHDTKRSEDVRARINVLSEIPEEWETKLQEWHKLNRQENNIEPRHEYLLYQTLIGTWPTTCIPENYCNRITDYMLKAIKEEKLTTSWIHPNIEYENLLVHFIRKILSPKSEFINEMELFVSQICIPGYLNSLAQVLLKCTSPGVPDFYQGSELWIYDLVDPDNRRLVNFIVRKKMLELLKQKPPLESMIQEIDSGLLKMYVMQTCLAVRNKYPKVYQSGSYIPLKVTGNRKQDLIAFIRVYEGQTVITVCGRFFTKNQSWKDTRIILPTKYQATKRYDHIHSKEIINQNDPYIEVSELFQQLPFALLELSK